MNKKHKRSIKIGQLWQENDRRFMRVVKILAVSEVLNEVEIKTVKNMSSPASVGRVTHAKLSRFNGKSRGYSLLTGCCHECQLKRGAKLPDNSRCVTVSLGPCSECLEYTGLVPDCDYNWPDGRKAVFD